jgi:hypothetical protein
LFRATSEFTVPLRGVARHAMHGTSCLKVLLVEECAAVLRANNVVNTVSAAPTASVADPTLSGARTRLRGDAPQLAEPDGIGAFVQRLLLDAAKERG